MNLQRALILGICGVSLAACTQVSPGNVGVKVSQWAGRGVEPDVLSVGTYFTPFGTHIYEYQTSTQNYTWTASANEGKKTDESFNFQSNEGLPINADIGVSFSVDPTKAPILFQKYRLGLPEIVEGPLRNEIRSVLIREASTYGVGELYGNKKTELLMKAQKDAQAFFSPYGLNVESLYWADIRFPQSVAQQIENRIRNEQAAQAALAQVATVKAEADQKVAEAEGEAKSIQLRGDALKANPGIIKMSAIDAWKSGGAKMPMYISGGQGLPFIGDLTKAEQ